MREVHLHHRPIFATQRGTFGKGVGRRCLISPFSLGACGIGIECGQRIGVLDGKGRHVVDEGRGAFHSSAASKPHVYATLGLQQQAHTALRVGSRKHGHIAIAVDIVVVA